RPGPRGIAADDPVFRHLAGARISGVVVPEGAGDLPAYRFHLVATEVPKLLTHRDLERLLAQVDIPHPTARERGEVFFAVQLLIWHGRVVAVVTRPPHLRAHVIATHHLIVGVMRRVDTRVLGQRLVDVGHPAGDIHGSRLGGLHPD